MPKYKNIGFIGTGKIAPSHADVLTHLGCKIVAATSRTGGESSLRFKSGYSLTSIYLDWREMLDQNEIDALWVTPSWNVIDEIIVDLIQTGIPLFLEKPVALSSRRIQEAIEAHADFKQDIQVGYNRRFYDFIPRLKKAIGKGTVRSVIVEVPESVKGKSDELVNYLYIQNSSHVFDLLFHLFGSLSILKASSTNNGGHSQSVLLESSEKGFPINLVTVWDTPSNFTIKIFIDDEVIILSPLEVYKRYKDFEILEPNAEMPIRRYVPQEQETLFCMDSESKFKPGFFNQTEYFLGINKQRGFTPANLESSYEITCFCEQLMGLG